VGRDRVPRLSSVDDATVVPSREGEPGPHLLCPSHDVGATRLVASFRAAWRVDSAAVRFVVAC